MIYIKLPEQKVLPLSSIKSLVNIRMFNLSQLVSLYACPRVMNPQFVLTYYHNRYFIHFLINRFFFGGIPFTAHGAKIPPPLILYYRFFLVFKLILGKVRLSSGQACPAGIERFSQGPAELEKSKIRVGGYLYSKSKTRDSPFF